MGAKLLGYGRSKGLFSPVMSMLIMPSGEGNVGRKREDDENTGKWKFTHARACTRSLSHTYTRPSPFHDSNTTELEQSPTGGETEAWRDSKKLAESRTQELYLQEAGHAPSCLYSPGICKSKTPNNSNNIKQFPICLGLLSHSFALWSYRGGNRTDTSKRTDQSQAAHRRCQPRERGTPEWVSGWVMFLLLIPGATSPFLSRCASAEDCQ